MERKKNAGWDGKGGIKSTTQWYIPECHHSAQLVHVPIPKRTGLQVCPG